jgi:hypothetical protein
MHVTGFPHSRRGVSSAAARPVHVRHVRQARHATLATPAAPAADAAPIDEWARESLDLRSLRGNGLSSVRGGKTVTSASASSKSRSRDRARGERRRTRTLRPKARDRDLAAARERHGPQPGVHTHREANGRVSDYALSGARSAMGSASACG